MKSGRVRLYVVYIYMHTYLQVGSRDIRSETLWRLVRHLDPVLEDANRKMIGRITREPQSKIRMNRFRRETLAYLLGVQTNRFDKSTTLRRDENYFSFFDEDIRMKVFETFSRVPIQLLAR